MDEINDTLNELCAHCDEEAERQETVLEVCRAQLHAARAHDLEQLEAKTAVLLLLIQDTANAERTRLRLLRDVAEHFRLPPGQETLTGLIAAVPAPWSARLREFQARLRAAVEETRHVVRQNRMVMRRSLSVLNRALEAAFQTAGVSRSAYDARGEARRGVAPQAAVLDQRG
ncbi:MAG TPA: flagellar export chaperone FlgN [Candidatus Hydrogenedentes bacterium]|nr:flagellar export chaperone FlgN [Candidatus Hydrogenedentota bacterium]